MSKFQELIDADTPLLVDFSAEWCGPCKQIEKLVHGCMMQVPNHVQCAVIDIDESFALYSFLKTKKVVSSIPTILVYNQGNTHYVPDDGVIGAASLLTGTRLDDNQRRLLGTSGTNDVMQSESNFAAKLRTTKIEGDIELF